MSFPSELQFRVVVCKNRCGNCRVSTPPRRRQAEASRRKQGCSEINAEQVELTNADDQETPTWYLSTNKDASTASIFILTLRFDDIEEPI